MKIDRLIGIIATLQQHKKVTAPYLAEKFEVSRRTISRDIEDICKAGIPLVTTQGGDGGIAIMEGFHLDTTVFTEEELQSVFIGLKSLDSVSSTSYSMKLAAKFGKSSLIPLAGNMMIDLSSFYKESLSLKIDLLKKAMQEKKRVRFHYYYPKGEADMEIEPYFILFKWAAWYLFGFSFDRQDYRMYKLNRLWELIMTDTAFVPREIPEEKMAFGSHMTDDYIVKAKFDASVKYRLVEDRGPGSFTVGDDGFLFADRGFTSKDDAIAWFLEFGDKAEILSPPEMREKLKEATVKIQKKYS